jgi:hypothetical protein
VNSAGGVTQGIELLPKRHKVLSSNSRIDKKNSIFYVYFLICTQDDFERKKLLCPFCSSNKDLGNRPVLGMLFTKFFCPSCTIEGGDELVSESGGSPK